MDKVTVDGAKARLPVPTGSTGAAQVSQLTDPNDSILPEMPRPPTLKVDDRAPTSTPDIMANAGVAGTPPGPSKPSTSAAKMPASAGGVKRKPHPRRGGTGGAGGGRRAGKAAVVVEETPEQRTMKNLEVFEKTLAGLSLPKGVTGTKTARGRCGVVFSSWEQANGVCVKNKGGG